MNSPDSAICLFCSDDISKKTFWSLYVLKLLNFSAVCEFRMKFNFRSQSGTGKTATYSISILQNINTKSPKTQALVLSPTRELAVQIKKVYLHI